jgi:hypothetical protein
MVSSGGAKVVEMMANAENRRKEPNDIKEPVVSATGSGTEPSLRILPDAKEQMPPDVDFLPRVFLLHCGIAPLARPF